MNALKARCNLYLAFLFKQIKLIIWAGEIKKQKKEKHLKDHLVKQGHQKPLRKLQQRKKHNL